MWSVEYRSAWQCSSFTSASDLKHRTNFFSRVIFNVSYTLLQTLQFSSWFWLLWNKLTEPYLWKEPVDKVDRFCVALIFCGTRENDCATVVSSTHCFPLVFNQCFHLPTNRFLSTGSWHLLINRLPQGNAINREMPELTSQSRPSQLFLAAQKLFRRDFRSGRNYPKVLFWKD